MLNNIETIKSDLDEAIPPDVMEVINFISDKQIAYEKETEERIKKEVQEKYGENGLKVYNDLNEPTGNDECPECTASEEILEEEDESSVPNFILDQIADNLIENYQVHHFSKTTCSQILSSVKEVYPEYLDFITVKDINKICQIIIFKGIDEGWLFESYFDLSAIPKEILERSKEPGQMSDAEIKSIEDKG